jgi:hypothetical protein
LKARAAAVPFGFGLDLRLPCRRPDLELTRLSFYDRILFVSAAGHEELMLARIVVAA